jgi:hypothetical protein
MMELYARFPRERDDFERAWLRVESCAECFALVAAYQIDLHEAIHRHPSQRGAEHER